jgi:O-antigen/teichoic acid export membrane protein
MYRVAGKLFKVAFFQTSVQFSFLIVLLSSLWIKIENNKLLILLLTVYIIAEFISLLLFVIRSPLKPKLFNSRVISIKEMKDSFIQGVNLLLYNVSFHFMILGTKTIISYFYTVEEFGFFAFSWNLAQATIMILQIVSFILYPKMLNKFSLLDNKKIYDLISSVKNVYVSISFLFVYIAFTIIFVLIKIFPKYESAFPLFIILSLSVSLYNFSFGSSTYLIARKKETILSWYSFISCIICICIALLLSLLKIAYIYVGLSIFISYCVMTITVNRKVYNLLNDKENLSHSIKEFFSYKIWIPIIATLLIIQINNSIFYFIPLLLFIFLNFKMLIDSAKLTKNMLNNSNLLKL